MVIKFFGIETCALARRGNPASGPVNIFRIHVARAGLQTPPTYIGVTNPSYIYRGYKPLLHISGLQTPPTYIGVTNPSYIYRGYKPLLHISGLQTPPTHIGVTNPSYKRKGTPTGIMRSERLTLHLHLGQLRSSDTRLTDPRNRQQDR